MRRSLALLLVCAAGSAPAMEDVGPCVMLGDSEKIVTHEQAGDSSERMFEVYPTALPNGFVVSEVFPEGLAIQVLTHCPSGQYLMTITPQDREFEVLGRFDEMMEDSRGYTLDQISAEMQRLGAFSRRGEGGIGGCDCAAVYGQ